jgi:hypothetical protein
MKPLIPLTDPRFQYVNAASTDLRKTFARVRAEMKPNNVKPIPQRKKA